MTLVIQTDDNIFYNNFIAGDKDAFDGREWQHTINPMYDPYPNYADKNGKAERDELERLQAQIDNDPNFDYNVLQFEGENWNKIYHILSQVDGSPLLQNEFSDLPNQWDNYDIYNNYSINENSSNGTDDALDITSLVNNNEYDWLYNGDGFSNYHIDGLSNALAGLYSWKSQTNSNFDKDAFKDAINQRYGDVDYIDDTMLADLFDANRDGKITVEEFATPNQSPIDDTPTTDTEELMKQLMVLLQSIFINLFAQPNLSLNFGNMMGNQL